MELGLIMMDGETELSFTMAQMVQRLKGTHLHSQLERQAKVSMCSRATGASYLVSLARKQLMLFWVSGMQILADATTAPTAVSVTPHGWQQCHCSETRFLSSTGLFAQTRY